MSWTSRFAGWMALSVLACTYVATAQTTSGALPDASAQAAEFLKQMSGYVGSANEFTFRADVTLEHVLPSGQKLQFMAVEEVALQRPGHL